MKVACGNCGQTYLVGEPLIGKSVKCQKCQFRFVVQRPQEESEAAPQVAPPAPVAKPAPARSAAPAAATRTDAAPSAARPSAPAATRSTLAKPAAKVAVASSQARRAPARKAASTGEDVGVIDEVEEVDEVEVVDDEDDSPRSRPGSRSSSRTRSSPHNVDLASLGSSDDAEDPDLFEDDEDEEDRRSRRRNKKKKGKGSGFKLSPNAKLYGALGAVALILVLGIASVVAMPVAYGVSIGMVICGLGCALYGNLRIIAAAFQEDVVCGLLYLFAPIYPLYYLISRWSDVGVYWLTSLLGVVVVLGGAAYPSLIQAVRQGMGWA